MDTSILEEGAPAPSSDYVDEGSFDDMHLSPEVRQGVTDRGYLRPTPVQTAAYAPILAGRDVIVRSKTGTGKTAAFGIPILERIPAGRRVPSALVMCPTRELAIQVADEIAALARHKDLSVVTVYGGASMSDQLEKLRNGAEIVVGTPGRIHDHIRRGTLKLGEVLVCCLDEADEMLNMGFFEDVTRILAYLPDACQQLLFSATVPADIQQLIHDYLTDPETILLSGDEFKVDNIHNVFFHTVDSYPKPRNLLYMLEQEEPTSAIVFCNTRSDTSLVTAVLNRNGYDAELLNGDLPQKDRERVMAKVKRGDLRFMVATDIAARGIDISDLSHVVNYSLPEDPAIYLHRVGRTGRIGKKGTALSLVSGSEMMTLKALQTKYGIPFEEKVLPAPEEARRVWTTRKVQELEDAMSATVFEAYIPLAQRLKARSDGDFLIAFALKYFFSRHHAERVQMLQKAEQKREEHERRELSPPRREAVGAPVERDGSARSAAPEGREAAARGAAPEGRRRRGDRAVRGVERRAEGSAEGGRPRRARRDERSEGSGSAGEASPQTVTREAVPTAAAAVEIAAGWASPAGEAPGVEVSAERPSREAPPREAAEAGPQQGRVFLSLGEKDGADEAKVRAAVASLAPDVALLGVEVRPSHSYLLVSPGAVEGAVLALHGKELEGKALTAERARRRRR